MLIDMQLSSSSTDYTVGYANDWLNSQWRRQSMRKGENVAKLYSTEFPSKGAVVLYDDGTCMVYFYAFGKDRQRKLLEGDERAYQYHRAYDKGQTP